MFTQVEPEALNTKKFLSGVIDSLLEHEPLSSGKLIEVLVGESTAGMPEFTENVLKTDNGTGLREVKKDGRTLSGQELREQGYHAEDQIENKVGRNINKYAALHTFLHDELSDCVSTQWAEWNDPHLLSFSIPFLVVTPERVRQRKVELHDQIAKYNPAELANGYTEAEFTECPPQITWRGATICIPPNSRQLCLCRVAFNKPVGEVIHWDEVAAEIDGLPRQTTESKWQSVYNAALAVNRKTVAKVGSKLFDTARLSLVRKA